MSRQRFSSGVRFRWQEMTYQIVRLLPGGQANLEDILTGAMSIVETNALVHALFADELQFVSENAPVLPNRAADETPISLSDYPDALVDVARYRLEVIHPLLGMEQRTRAAVLGRVQEVKTTQPDHDDHTLHDSLSAAAIYRWIGDYVRSGQDLRALIPAVHARGGKQDQTAAQRGRGAAGAGHPGQVPKCTRRSPLTMCIMSWRCAWRKKTGCARRRISSGCLLEPH